MARHLGNADASPYNDRWWRTDLTDTVGWPTARPMTGIIVTASAGRKMPELTTMAALRVDVPGKRYHAGLISCQVACPVHTDARGYVRAIAEGRFADAPEPADHVAVESAFMSYLAMKQAYAVASSDPERAGITAEAAASFSANHLAAMVEPIARALEFGGPSYLALGGQALFERVGPAPHRGLPVIEGPEPDDHGCGPSGAAGE